MSEIFLRVSKFCEIVNNTLYKTDTSEVSVEIRICDSKAMQFLFLQPISVQTKRSRTKLLQLESTLRK